MKFIIDAQLPSILSEFIKEKTHDSVHTLELPEANKTQDGEIIEIAKTESRVVISKDSDFLQSHLIKGSPEKLILVSTGNISNRKLMTIFRKDWDNIVSAIKKYKLVEITSENLIIHG